MACTKYFDPKPDVPPTWRTILTFSWKTFEKHINIQYGTVSVLADESYNIPKQQGVQTFILIISHLPDTYQYHNKYEAWLLLLMTQSY